MKRMTISVDTLNLIFDFLGKQPYTEVANLINVVQNDIKEIQIAGQKLSIVDDKPKDKK